MANKKPLAIYSGNLKELQSGDFISAISTDTVFPTTDISGNVVLRAQNMYFYIDGNNKVFFRADGTGNAVQFLDNNDKIGLRRFI